MEAKKVFQRFEIVNQNVVVDKFTYYGEDCSFQNVDIGKFCSISSGVIIGIGSHPVNEFVSTYPAFFASNNIGCNISFVHEQLFQEYKHSVIGNDVWIGRNVIVLDGIKIGNGAIIGAGSVVTKDVLPYSIVAGNPAKIIRYRFDESKIKLLQKFEWWDRDIEWIIQNASSFNSDVFFEKLINDEFNNTYQPQSNHMLLARIIVNNRNKSLDFSNSFNKIFDQINEFKEYSNQYIIYGNGTVGKMIQALIPEIIVGYVDIEDEKNHPINLKNLKYDKIIISVLGREDSIIKYLTYELGIERDKILTFDLSSS